MYTKEQKEHALKEYELFYLHMSLSCTATYASKITFCDVTEQTPYYTV